MNGFCAKCASSCGDMWIQMTCDARNQKYRKGVIIEMKSSLWMEHGKLRGGWRDQGVDHSST